MCSDTHILAFSHPPDCLAVCLEYDTTKHWLCQTVYHPNLDTKGDSLPYPIRHRLRTVTSPSAEGRPDPYVIPAFAGIHGRRGVSRNARNLSLL